MCAEGEATARPHALGLAAHVRVPARHSKRSARTHAVAAGAPHPTQFQAWQVSKGVGPSRGLTNLTRPGLPATGCQVLGSHADTVPHIPPALASTAAAGPYPGASSAASGERGLAGVAPQPAVAAVPSRLECHRRCSRTRCSHPCRCLSGRGIRWNWTRRRARLQQHGETHLAGTGDKRGRAEVCQIVNANHRAACPACPRRQLQGRCAGQCPPSISHLPPCPRR